MCIHAQGIPWEDLQPPRTRQEYRDIRMQSYPNYQNLGEVCTMHKDDIQRELLRPETVCDTQHCAFTTTTPLL